MTIEFDKKKVIKACNTSNPYAGLDALEQLVKAHNELEHINNCQADTISLLAQKLNTLEEKTNKRFQYAGRSTIFNAPVHLEDELEIVTPAEWEMYQALIKQMKKDIRAFVEIVEKERKASGMINPLLECPYQNLKRHCDE